MLIRDPEDPRKFYPRFNMEDTSNFSELDEHRYLIFDTFRIFDLLLSDLERVGNWFPKI